MRSLIIGSIALASLVIASSAQGQFSVTLDDDSSVSGRIGAGSLAGVDYQFGTAQAQTAAAGDGTVAFSANNSLLGDNPSNVKFAQMWRFTLTQPFINDLGNNLDVQLRFTSGVINNGGGAPSAVSVYLLTAGATTGRVDAAGETPIATLSSVVGGTAQNTLYTIPVNSLPGGLVAGNAVWFGLMSSISTNATANNIYIAGTATSINAQLVTVPEPASAGLLGLVSVVLLRRRR